MTIYLYVVQGRMPGSAPDSWSAVSSYPGGKAASPFSLSDAKNLKSCWEQEGKLRSMFGDVEYRIVRCPVTDCEVVG